MSWCILKFMNLVEPKRLVNWNGGSRYETYSSAVHHLFLSILKPLNKYQNNWYYKIRRWKSYAPALMHAWPRNPVGFLVLTEKEYNAGILVGLWGKKEEYSCAPYICARNLRDQHGNIPKKKPMHPSHITRWEKQLVSASSRSISFIPARMRNDWRLTETWHVRVPVYDLTTWSGGDMVPELGLPAA